MNQQETCNIMMVFISRHAVHRAECGVAGINFGNMIGPLELYEIKSVSYSLHQFKNINLSHDNKENIKIIINAVMS